MAKPSFLALPRQAVSFFGHLIICLHIVCTYGVDVLRILYRVSIYGVQLNPPGLLNLSSVSVSIAFLDSERTTEYLVE